MQQEPLDQEVSQEPLVGLGGLAQKEELEELELQVSLAHKVNLVQRAPQDQGDKVEQREEQDGQVLKDKVGQLVALDLPVHKDEREVLDLQVHKVLKDGLASQVRRDLLVSQVPLEEQDGPDLKVELEVPVVQDLQAQKEEQGPLAQ